MPPTDPSSGGINPSLAKLAADPERITKLRLWNALTTEDREKAATAYLASSNAKLARTTAIKLVAEARHFRPQTVAAYSDEKLAHEIARIKLQDLAWIWDAIRAGHLQHHREMMSVFLDALGIPHDNGEIASSDIDDEPIAAADIIRGADGLAARYPLDEVVIYMCALKFVDPVGFKHVEDWLRLRFEQDQDGKTTVSLALQPQAPQPGAAPIQATEFTVLDNRLIRLVVDTVAEVTGAPTREEFDDLLLDIEQLSSSRHPTFFHVGFRDALFGRDPQPKLPAENKSRRRWYWSGYVAGLARGGDLAPIVRLYDERQHVREIATAVDGAAETSLGILFSALCSVGRYGEAAALATPKHAARSSDLRLTMLGTATGLIRDSRAADARPMLDTLWAALPDEFDEYDPFWVWVMRRRALCLRQVGDRPAALELFEELAEHPDDTTRAIAFSDLGLLQLGKRRLGDVTLPPVESDLPTFIESFEAAETLFQRSVELEGAQFKPAHAQYCLGVLDIARGKHADATDRFDSALSYFSANPTIYSTDGTLALTELYLGVSICQSMDHAGRVERACELIRSGLQRGARLPRWLVRSTIDTVSLARADLSIPTATDLLASDPEALDELIGSAVGTSAPTIANALFARAAIPGRPATERIADYRRVLPLLLRSGSIDRAKDALAYLEERAADGIGTAEMIALLEDPANYSSAWSTERADEARMHLLESEGRFVESASLIEKLSYRLLASAEEYGVDRAELLVGHLEDYGSDFTDLAAQIAKHIDGRRGSEEAEVVSLASPMRVLVFGGNEIQEKMHESIIARVRKELPGVDLDFIHSGWSSNWPRFVAEFDRRVGLADGVVMLAMVRTTLGETVRHSCPVPWRGCRGKGQGQIVEAIRRLVPMAERHRRRLTSPAKST